jgi:hypothetical protein
MSPITHLLASWIVAAKTTDNLRDRRLVTLAGVAPDLDGLGIIVRFISGLSAGIPCGFENINGDWIPGPTALLR